MTESLGPQFQQQELPGIDWFMLREYAPLNTEDRQPPTPRKTTPETARVALPGMEKVNQFYGEEQKNQLSSQLDVFRKTVARHPLPKGYSIRHSASTSSDDGSTKHIIELFKNRDNPAGYIDDAEEVGRMSWNGDTGRVSWFGIDQGHRGLASHMVVEAHKIAARTGSVGPTHSDDLSGDSYRLLKKHAPAFLPSNAIVAGRTIDEYEARLADRQKSRQRS